MCTNDRKIGRSPTRDVHAVVVYPSNRRWMKWSPARFFGVPLNDWPLQAETRSTGMWTRRRSRDAEYPERCTAGPAYHMKVPAVRVPCTVVIALRFCVCNTLEASVTQWSGITRRNSSRKYWRNARHVTWREQSAHAAANSGGSGDCPYRSYVGASLKTMVRASSACGMHRKCRFEGRFREAHGKHDRKPGALNASGS